MTNLAVVFYKYLQQAPKVHCILFVLTLGSMKSRTVNGTLKPSTTLVFKSQ